MKINFETSPVHVKERIQTRLVIALDRHSASLLENTAQVGCGQSKQIRGQNIIVVSEDSIVPGPVVKSK